MAQDGGGPTAPTTRTATHRHRHRHRHGSEPVPSRVGRTTSDNGGRDLDEAWLDGLVAAIIPLVLALKSTHADVVWEVVGFILMNRSSGRRTTTGVVATARRAVVVPSEFGGAGAEYYDRDEYKLRVSTRPSNPPPSVHRRPSFPDKGRARGGTTEQRNGRTTVSLVRSIVLRTAPFVFSMTRGRSPHFQTRPRPSVVRFVPFRTSVAFAVEHLRSQFCARYVEPQARAGHVIQQSAPKATRAQLQPPGNAAYGIRSSPYPAASPSRRRAGGPGDRASPRTSAAPAVGPLKSPTWIWPLVNAHDPEEYSIDGLIEEWFDNERGGDGNNPSASSPFPLVGRQMHRAKMPFLFSLVPVESEVGQEVLEVVQRPQRAVREHVRHDGVPVVMGSVGT
ncbi:hypothetical protein THAOC_24296, partial [Thalassiosira oceanica]